MAKKTINNKQTIKNVKVANFMGLEALEFSPRGHTVVVAGNNDQGKTSLLTFLRSVLAGKYEFPAMPIRAGADKAEGSVTLDDLKIEWSLAKDAKTHQLKITDRTSGKKVAGSEQGLLKRLFGTFALDPMKFDRLDPREQIAYLNTVMKDADGNPIDLAEYEKEHQKLYDARSEANRARKAAVAVLGDNPPVDDAPEAAVSIADAIDAHTAATTAMRMRSDLDAAVSRAASDVAHAEGKVADLRNQLLVAEAALAKSQDHHKAAVKRAEAAGPIDDIAKAVAAAKHTLDTASATNAAFDAHQKHLAARDASEAAAEAYEASEKALADLKAGHDARLQAANLPVVGLEWREGMLWYKDIPLKQNSTRNRVFVYWHLALAENPDMPIVFFDDANMLDDDARAYIADLSEKHKAQTFLVMVGENAQDAQLIIRNGKGVAK